MSEFKVKTQGLRNAENEEAQLQKQMQDICNQVIQQKNNISFRSGAAENIRWRLNNASNKISEECRTLRRMQDRLSQTADKYEKTENTICGVVRDGKVTNWEKIRTQSLTKEIGGTAAKTVFDIVEQAGPGGGTLSVLTTLAKVLVDGDGFSPKDYASLAEGGWKTIKNFIDSRQLITNREWKELFGLTKYKNLVLNSGTRWGNASATFGKSFMDELGIETTRTGATKVAGTTIAGWAFSFLTNAAGNYEEYKRGDITGGRAWAETFMETGIDIVKGAAIGAAVAAGAAALGIGAPAIVVAGAGVVVSAGLDFVCKKITGAVLGEEKGLTETISDAVLDVGEKVFSGVGTAAKEAGRVLTGAWSSAKNAFCGWGKALGFA